MTGTCKFETKTQKLKLLIIHFEKHFLLITSNSKLHFLHYGHKLWNDDLSDIN